MPEEQPAEQLDGDKEVELPDLDLMKKEKENPPENSELEKDKRGANGTFDTMNDPYEKDATIPQTERQLLDDKKPEEEAPENFGDDEHPMG